MTIPIVDEIFAALVLLTEKDLERSARNCKPVQSTDKTLGRLHNEMLCRLWAQGDQYRYLCRETALRAEREADSPEESKVFLEMAARYDGLEDCCRDMFWTQAREDMGCWAAKRIGLRSGWMLVETPEQPSTLPSFLAGLGIINGQPEE